MELHPRADGSAGSTGRPESKTPKRNAYNEVPLTASDHLIGGTTVPSAASASGPAVPNYDGASASAPITPAAPRVLGGAEIISVDAAIDALGTGPFQLRILVAAGLCFAADSMEIMLLSFLSGILREEWGLTPNQTATITSCVFLGSLLGTLILGRLGDRVGRRPVFLACGVIISVFGVATAFAGGYLSLLATRFLVGFGVGGLTVPFDILAEFLPTKTRGRYLLLIEYFWTVGSMMTPIIAYCTIGVGASWKLFVLICAIPCIFSFIIGALAVPESPRWLLSQGRREEALDVLRGAAVVNKIDPGGIFPPGTELLEEEEESSRFADLLKPKWRKLTLLLWGAWLGFAFGYWGTIMIVTRIFESEDEGNVRDDDAAASGETVDFDYWAIFISSSAEVVGTALVIFTIDRVGRIPTQVSSYTIGGICLFLLCFFSQSDNRWFLVAVSFGARVCEMMGSCVTWVTTAEVLSTEIRTTGHSAANAIARIGGFLSPYLVGGNLPLRTVGFIMLSIHILTALCASRLPETMGKRLGHATSDVGESNLGHQHETELSTKNDGTRLPSISLTTNLEGRLT